MIRTIQPICRFFALFGIFCLLQSCSFLGLDTVFRDRSNDYRQAQSFPEMETPPELDSQRLGQLYPIPAGGEVAQYEIDSAFEVPRPRSVALNESANEVKIQRLGDSAWILIAVPPSEAWPRIRSYLTRTGVPTARADASRGVIETGLFKLSEEPEYFQQYRISLSQGVQLNSTEVEIIQRAFLEGTVPQNLPVWNATSDDEELASWLRTDLAEDLASDGTAGSASLLGQEIGAASKVEMITPENDSPYIEMKTQMDRAWASVGYALTRNGFTIVQDQRDLGMYLVDFQEPQADSPGWLGRVFSLGRSEEEITFSYRVTVQPLDETVEIRVENLDGPAMSQRENFVVLQRIRNSLG